MPLTEMQEKWVSALESGEYKQTAKMLHNVESGGYCCLGVACHVVLGSHDRATNGEGYWQMHNTYPPSSVVCSLGLRSSSGLLSGAEISGHPCLAYANDEGVSHERIAAFIRANPEAVFIQEVSDA